MIRSILHRALFFAVAALFVAAPVVEAAPASSQKKKTTASSSRKPAPKKKSAAKPKAKPKAKPAARRPSAPEADQPIYPQPFVGVPVTGAASELLFDAVSGRILHEKNADERRPPASTQKLLTALIIVEAGNLDKPVVIQHIDTLAEPVKLYLKAGQVYTRRELVTALLVKSFNDVAVALARDNAGSVEAFAAKMNRKAAQLGMVNSNFMNPNGLPAKGQYSTARDMARVARAAYQNGAIRQMVATKVLNFHYADGRVRQFKNTNRVLRGWPYCNGMKTGYTIAAGHCLISSASRDGRAVISVMLGYNRAIWQDSCSLLAWGLDH